MLFLYEIRSVTIILFLAVLCSCNRQVRNTTEKESKKDSASSIVHNNPDVTTDGIVFFSLDNGVTWENKSKGLPDTISLGLGAIAVSENSLAIATKEMGVYLFDFQRDKWVHIPSDKRIIEGNPGPLAFYNGSIYIGTQKSGIFFSANHGKNWIMLNTGLATSTIRKLVEVDNTLYAGTNTGLYSYNDQEKKWELEYGNSILQVNGITGFDGNIYIGTTQGAFTALKGGKGWKQILANYTLHNISWADGNIYAMTYNELLLSTDKGQSWQNIQKGLPAQLYTFNVIKNGNSVFAGQWDGVYRKNNALEIWKSYNNGLPDKLAITNMNLYKGIIVVSGSERRLRAGMTTEK